MKALFAKYGISDVESLPPKELGSTGNGISNVVKLLPSLLLKIKSGDYDNFGILVDADYSGTNGGFIERKSEIESILIKAGYTELPKTIANQLGSEYVNSNLTPIHLIIMPNHSEDGMIEDLLLGCAPIGEHTRLMTHAKETVNALPIKAYNQNLHTAKAELATYLAWNKSPGCDCGIAIKTGALDSNSINLSPLREWLLRAFS